MRTEESDLITEAELRAELAAIEAETIGWHPLGEGAYLHVGDPEGDGHPRGGGAGGVRVGL